VADQHVQTASQPGEHIPSFLCTRVRELKTHPRSMRGARFTQSLVHSLTHPLWSHCWHLHTSVLPRPLCAHLHKHTRLAHITFWRGTATAWREQVRSRFRVAPVDHFATTKVRADCFSIFVRPLACTCVCAGSVVEEGARGVCRAHGHSLALCGACASCSRCALLSHHRHPRTTRLSSTWAAQSQRSCTREGIAGQRHLWQASTTIAGAARLYMLCISHGCAVSSHLALRNTLAATLTQRHW
jgi:hypothetical protein